MPTSSRKTLISVAIVAGSLAGVLVLVIAGSAIVFYWRHVQTAYVRSETAAREFETARARFAGQQPLIELRGLLTPIVRRSPSAPRRDLHALHALAYDVGEGQLRRADVPATLLRLVTIGGRIRFMNLGLFGDDRDRITLEDLERHGPGLVIDIRGGSAWPTAMGDALFGTDSRGSQMLIWTE